MEYYSAIRKDEIPPFVTTWMDSENMWCAKQIKSDEESQEPYLGYKTENNK